MIKNAIVAVVYGAFICGMFLEVNWLVAIGAIGVIILPPSMCPAMRLKEWLIG